MSFETNYQARKRQEADARASTPEAMAERLALNEVSDQVAREFDAKYSAEVLRAMTPAEGFEALQWQRERLAQLRCERNC